jgi:hypothetical protein
VGTVVRIPFEVTGFEPEPLALGEPGPVAFGRVTLRKTFSGALTGTSVVTMTSVSVGETPAGYTAVELVTGALDGRAGTVVLQHSGVVDGTDSRASGVVLPGQLSGAVLTLDYELG